MVSLGQPFDQESQICVIIIVSVIRVLSLSFCFRLNCVLRQFAGSSDLSNESDNYVSGGVRLVRGASGRKHVEVLLTGGKAPGTKRGL